MPELEVGERLRESSRGLGLSDAAVTRHHRAITDTLGSVSDVQHNRPVADRGRGRVGLVAVMAVLVVAVSAAVAGGLSQRKISTEPAMSTADPAPPSSTATTTTTPSSGQPEKSPTTAPSAMGPAARRPRARRGRGSRCRIPALDGCVGARQRRRQHPGRLFVDHLLALLGNHRNRRTFSAVASRSTASGSVQHRVEVGAAPQHRGS